MKHIDSLWSDTVGGMLTEQDFTAYRTAVIQAPVTNLAGRQVLPVKTVAPGTRIVDFQTLISYGDAKAIKPGADFPAMNLNGTLSHAHVGKFGVEFSIPREDIESARRGGVALDTSYAQAASWQVQKKENDVIWNGDTTLGIPGLLTDATGAYSSAGWSSGDVYDDIVAALGEVPAEYAGLPMALVGPRVNIAQLLRKNTYIDKSYMAMIKEELNVSPFVDTNYTSGTSLLMPIGEQVAALVQSHGLDMDPMEYVMKNQSYNGNAFVESAPVAYVPSALIKITGL